MIEVNVFYIQLSEYIIALLVLAFSKAHNTCLDYTKKLSIHAFWKKMIVAISIALFQYITIFTVSFIDYCYGIGLFIQYVIEIGYITFLIMVWLQCFYAYFKSIPKSLMLIVAWIINQIWGFIPSIISFIIFTLMAFIFLKRSLVIKEQGGASN